MVELVGFDTLNKVATEAYRELCKKEDGCLYVSLTDVKSKIIYNIEAKAYDIIYNLSINDIENHEIVKILDFNNFTYLDNKVVKNPAQIELKIF